MTNEMDIGSIEHDKKKSSNGKVEKQELKLIPPSDPRVQSAIAPFSDDMLAEHGYQDRKELANDMYDTMKKYGGIGLTCNQVGLPFNMFVIGGHFEIEKGLTLNCFNPIIISSGEEMVTMKEGCLTFPFLWLALSRRRKVVVKYEDENGDLQEGHLDGMMSRVFQHEYDHILGRVFVERASKLKLDMGYKKAAKQLDKYRKRMEKYGSK